MSSRVIRKLQKQDQRKDIDPDDPETFDTRPDDDPIKVKGQNWCVFAFVIDMDAYRANNGLVDPYKHVLCKMSGSFKTPEQASQFALKLNQAYNSKHPLKAYHHLLVMPLRKFCVLPDMDRIVEDPDNPEKLRPLVPLLYEQEQLEKIMHSVKKENDAEIADKKKRIENGKMLGSETNMPKPDPEPSNIDELFASAITNQ
jgi:hypothetical protein